MFSNILLILTDQQRWTLWAVIMPWASIPRISTVWPVRVRVIPSVTLTTQCSSPAGLAFEPANIYQVTASIVCTMSYHQTKFSFPIFFVRLVTTPLFLANPTSLVTCGKCNIDIDFDGFNTYEWAPRSQWASSVTPPTFAGWLYIIPTS